MPTLAPGKKPAAGARQLPRSCVTAPFAFSGSVGAPFAAIGRTGIFEERHRHRGCISRSVTTNRMEMTMTHTEKQIAALEAKIAREREKLADAKAKAAAQSRKRDTRRKILFGYAFLDWLTALPRSERQRILKLVHVRLKERERIAFPLAEILNHVDAAAVAHTSAKKDDADTAQLPFPLEHS